MKVKIHGKGQNLEAIHFITEIIFFLAMAGIGQQSLAEGA